MNVLGVSGSPRDRSNSHILLENALHPFGEAGWSVEVLRLRDLTVKPCTACDHCAEHPSQCAIDDDMGLFIDAFRRCDALLVATPVYSRNVCAHLMAVFERHYAVKLERPLYGKIGGAIAVGAGGGGGQSIAICTIYNWMRSCGMVGVPGELNGVTAVALEEGEIVAQEKRLRQARILGDNVLHFAEKMRSEP